MSDHSIRRLHKARNLLGGKRYLEIGVRRGATFFGVDMLEKDAVDPGFAFEDEKRSAPGCRFFEITSDAFFVSGQARRDYDVVFLDGLHTFEQLLRDFCATLSLVSDRFVCLLDDTVPSDIFSAERSPTRARQLRRMAGRGGNSWHGDVFKVVFFIHDFFPNLSFATLQGSGNPQTIVWRAPRADFKPVFNDVEAIKRMTYGDMVQLEDRMRPMEEDAAFAEIAAAYGRPA